MSYCLFVGQPGSVFVVWPGTGHHHGVGGDILLCHVHDDICPLECLAQCVDRGPTAQERQHPNHKSRVCAPTGHVPRRLWWHGAAPG